MKLCPKCENEKPFEEFNKNKTQKDGYQRICKLCSQNEHKKWYYSNKNIQLEKNKGHRLKFKQWYIDLKKTFYCQKCKDTRWYILDFHHLDPSQKEFEIGNHQFSKYKLLEEISKCITLCRNCHQEFHHFEKEENITIQQYLKQ